MASVSGRLTSSRCGSVACFALAASVCLNGCSFVFVDGPPQHAPAYAGSAPREKLCTTSRLAPIVDTTLGALEMARAGVALASSAETYRKAGFDRSWELGLGLGFAALFWSSAVYGFVQTHECERYYRDVSLLARSARAPGRE
ncbi:MAG: hypothetical protein QM756_39480 [Polyangiaceae bacterium]